MPSLRRQRLPRGFTKKSKTTPCTVRVVRVAPRVELLHLAYLPPPTPATRSAAPAPSATPAAGRRCAGSLRRRRARRGGRRFRWPALRTRPNRKPAANRSPAPVVSTMRSIGKAGTATTPSFEATTQPFSLRVTTPSLVSLAQLRQRGVEIRGLVQRMQFGLVGENEIDGALAHQVEKLVAVAIDAERIRQRQRDLAAGVMRDRRGLDEGFLGALADPRDSLRDRRCAEAAICAASISAGVRSCAAPR